MKQTTEKVYRCDHCNKASLFSKDLYSYKLERFERNEARLKNMVRMPLTCAFYECEGGHDFERIEDNEVKQII